MKQRYASDSRESYRRYKIPKRFLAMPSAEIPLLSSGKVDSRQLKKLFDA